VGGLGSVTACKLDHPLGVSGTHLNFTLLAELEKYNLKKGVAFHYNGGGKVTAVAIEGII
jgi:acetyl-CoA acetyltransferase